MHLLLTSWVHYAPALPEMQSHTAAGRWVMPGKVPSARKARTMGGLKELTNVDTSPFLFTVPMVLRHAA